MIRSSLFTILAITILLTTVNAQDVQKYQVVRTADGGYFVSLPGLGKFAGPSGTGKTMGDVVGPETCLLEECHKWIRENWTDMRPLNLQKRMAADSLSVTDTKLRVVINHEEQYSLALVDDKVPEGWKDTGQVCVLSDCQKYIEEVWTDMRPLSLRKRPGRTK